MKLYYINLALIISFRKSYIFSTTLFIMVIPWIVIIISLLILAIFLKFEHHAKTIKTIILLLFLLLLGVSMYNMFKSQSIDTSSPKEIVNMVYMYFGWLGNTVSELWDIGKSTVQTVGNVIKIDKTNITVEEIDWNKQKESWKDKITSWIKK